MALLQRVNCMFGKHKRSRGRAHYEGDLFRSRCRGCGAPMWRTPSRWAVEAEAP